MAYDVIIVDTFNLYYRIKKDVDKTPIEKALRVIKYINEDLKRCITKTGKIYLLYDPLPKKDYGYSDKFAYTRIRNEINPDYKKNRKHDPLIQESLRLVREYYKYRGLEFVNVYGNSYEADDFVEPLVQKEDGKKIALYTSDMDWARYLSKKTVIINSALDTPYTDKMFEKDNGYYPTISSVTLYKAFYGDSSDKIVGVRKLPKLKFLSIYDIDALFMSVLNIYSNKSVAEFVQDVKSTTSVMLFDKIEKTDFEKFIMAIDSAMGGKESPRSALLDNIRVIKSRCNNIDSCCHSYEYSEKACSVIDATLGFSKKQKTFRFGGVSIR